jgi:hypothetical protein
VHTVLQSKETSPLGYSADRFDPGKQTLDVKYGNYVYSCKMGEEEKKPTTATASQVAYQDPGRQSSQVPTPGPANGWGGNYWDDWDEDDDWYWD